MKWRPCKERDINSEQKVYSGDVPLKIKLVLHLTKTWRRKMKEHTSSHNSVVSP